MAPKLSVVGQQLFAAHVFDEIKDRLLQLFPEIVFWAVSQKVLEPTYMAAQSNCQPTVLQP